MPTAASLCNYCFHAAGRSIEIATAPGEKKVVVLKTTHIELCINTHLFMFPPNTPWCVPKTHLKLCFVLVLNFTHFQVCSAERCVLSHVLMCNKAHL